MDDLYREVLLDHYKNPMNFGVLKNPDIRKQDLNPLCGDEIEIFAKLDAKKEKIREIRFKGHGCVICIASASILMQEMEGIELKKIQKMNTDDMLKLLGIELTPTRIKCMMLPLKAVQKGIIDYEAGK
ncbi:TPA: iron-sulfur cluster assembly scaffold protein [Candidatus Woesearchaeota archaeon]|nr:iron-sulfur cluster assembly scaffold protein [Candidatus Woesearchaeota archaeon]HIH31187.1 iron-sulfur cluster assembly scaffold protein [Candidatus Woesearchaeota archaeon]HIH55546.1 iron-sulfur cluster assembly scaffold protein [Candidatus Woesearchaeota archaeon]HIJ01833.1 iron-sulfur cluster assembly scaffold protein [Candidatus Woesearchaeota archaeon]HIJ13126.1 iron-sulfur cluster assembly scaffold protein [Candidatus Woesearchaeota archaeon]